MKESITLVVTSCGRFDFLSKTISSFFNYCNYPIDDVIIIDNSQVIGSYDVIENIISKYSKNYVIIINNENIGQVSSIDKAYSLVKTDYIFHCEDDWEFFDYGFIQKSIDVLNHDEKIVNINTRIRFDGERGSMHPVSEKLKTINDTEYRIYLHNYLGLWHGFSWNPGLRRKKDYDIISPYKQFNNEQGVGKKYMDLGFRSACLDKFYNKHIGTNSITEKSNS